MDVVEEDDKLETSIRAYKLQFQENTVRAATLMRELVQRRQDVLDKVDISANVIDVCILREGLSITNNGLALSSANTALLCSSSSSCTCL